MTTRTGLISMWVLSLTGALIGQVAGQLGFLLPAAGLATVGLIIGLRRPGNAVGPTCLAAGLSMGISGAAAGYGVSGLPGAEVGTWISGWSFFPSLGLVLVILPAIFPDGRVLSHRWRWLWWAAGLFILLAAVGNGLYPDGRNPYGIEGAVRQLDILLDLAAVPLFAGVVGAIVSVVARYRRGGWEQRQQLKWFGFTAALIPVAIGVGESNSQQLQPFAVPVVMVLFSLAIGTAVLRYRLYEIDRIISRTLSYALVTAALVGVYLGTVFVLRNLLPVEGSLAVAGSTLAVAAVFNPMRRRIQNLVDRRFNRSRFDAQKTMESFGRRIGNRADLGDLTLELAGVVASTLHPARLSVWLREAGDSARGFGWDTSGPPREQVGHLREHQRGEPARPVDVEVVLVDEQ